jgi:acyl-[acyl-carrier-protein]-phospholipid O-acyltransferase/long-chain-fatty-acid--[acyl-carrier-protein] ligase
MALPESADPMLPAADAAVPAAARLDHERLPPLFQDAAFWSMTACQFLGAFNDSVFKQIMLLLCVQVALFADRPPDDYQWLAQAVFSVPFVLFSGSAGFLADRITKRSVIVFCKLAEVAIMLAAMAGFAASGRGALWGLLVVLFFMGMHSAVFGPAKYGILPEMVRARDLPRVNGLIQMTTFLALILGTATAGTLMVVFRGELWKAAAICVGLAVAGSVAAFGVRRTPIAQPDARFRWSAVLVDPDTWHILRGDGELRRALAVYSLFWFVAALVPLAVNALGTRQLGLDEQATSFMLASVAVGIALGCTMAAVMSGDRVRFGLLRAGAWGLIGCLVLLSLPGPDAPHLLGYRGSQAVLALAGVFTGLFAVPIQVFLQARPPETLKGRMIGTMNLINWIGIIGSAGFYFVWNRLMRDLSLPESSTFLATAALLLPVAVFYRPRDIVLR